jgi:hypothetical protein
VTGARMETRVASNICVVSEPISAPCFSDFTKRDTGEDAGNGMSMTVTESKDLKTGDRVYWRGDPADSGVITETRWDAVTIAWKNGKVANVHHGDMREVHSTAAKPKGI